MQSQSLTRRFWCHSCRTEFTSLLAPGQQDILCPACRHPFCELLLTPIPKQFTPYQKTPTKTQNKTLRIGKRASPLRLIELQQILEEQQHQKQGIQMSHQELGQYLKRLEKDSECSVCRQDLKRGEQHLVFQCRHAFHQQCLVDWLRIKNSCPTCRQKMVHKQQS